jgi:hypothetical protein
MAYDSQHNQVVLFGGIDSSNTELNETWVWDGTNWTNVTPANPSNSPSVRFGFSMVYDSTHHEVVLFGGQGCCSQLNDTWLWDGLNWANVTPSNPADSPSAREYPAMAFDSAHNQVVLFGGITNTELGDMWLWDGTVWAPISPANPPSARYGSVMAYDAAQGASGHVWRLQWLRQSERHPGMGWHRLDKF